MLSDQLISVQEFCGYHQLDIAFVQTLEQHGLVQLITIEQTYYIEPDAVAPLEKLVRLHQDLAIHPDDLDVVNELVERIESLQQQIAQLQNRLAFYER